MYRPKQSLELSETPARPAQAVMRASSPAAPNASMNLHLGAQLLTFGELGLAREAVPGKGQLVVRLGHVGILEVLIHIHAIQCHSQAQNQQ